MASFAQLTPQGTILVNGTSGDNTIIISFSSDQVIVAMDGTSVQFARTAARRLYVDSAGGSDQVFNNTSLHSTLLGGDGADLLMGGRRSDSIVGGAGDDTINGGEGNDTMAGGDGVDWLEYGNRAPAVPGAFFQFSLGMIGGTSSFPVVVLDRFEEQTLENDACTDIFEGYGGSAQHDSFIAKDTGGRSVTFLGRGGDDEFSGASDEAPAIMSGGAGRDTFRGYHHNSSSAVTCTLLGGPGNDQFFYSDLPAVMDGGPGGDSLDPDNDPDAKTGITLDLRKFPSMEYVTAVGGVLIGDDRGNHLSGLTDRADASITIIGNGGNDTIVGGAFADHLYGGDGDDVISGGGGNDRIYGGNGNDIINGNSGNDHIWGGAGNDTLIGGPGRDHLYGEAGDDYLNTRDNKIDTLYGGDGDDSAKLDHNKANDIAHDIEKLV